MELSSECACAEYVLPEKKAAAEELRIQMAASKTPSLGSAARAAAAVRSEHEDRIQSLYADVCKVGMPIRNEDPHVRISESGSALVAPA